MQKLRNGVRALWASLAVYCLAALTLGTTTARAQSTYQFAIPTFSVYENATNVTIVVIRTGDTSVPGSVNFDTFDGVAGGPILPAQAPSDYTGTNGVLSFAAGDIVKTFDVFITDPVILDTEFDEYFTVALSNPMGGTIGQFGAAQVIIFDDDTCVAFSQTIYQVNEDATNAIITLTRTPPSMGPASVLLETFTSPQGGAIAPGDFTSLSTNLTFTNGQANIQVAIPIIDDCLVETNSVLSNRLEGILLQLTAQFGARVGMPGCPTNVATLNILDNDTDAGQFQFAIVGPVGDLEGSPFMPIRVRVSRLCGTNGAVSVDFEMFNDARTDPPNLCNGQLDAYWTGLRNDYTFTPGPVIFPNNLPGGTLTWATGDSSDKFIDITFVRDTRVELDESILIRLVRATGGATIGARRTFEVIIRNDDLPAGSSDTSYNTITVLNPTPGANNSVHAAVTYQDGTERTIIGGDFSAANAVVRNGIARILGSGAVDATFDPGSGADGFVSAIVLQPDGKVLVGGGFTSIDNISRYGIARLNDDGSLDNTFDVGAGVAGSVQAIALQPDGKVIIAGDFTAYNNVPRQRIARLNPDGSLDPDFDVYSGPDNTVYALALQGDGKVVIGGDFQQVNGEFASRITRLETNGVVDSTWLPIAGADNTVYAIRLQANGQAVIGGAFATYDGEPSSGLARLNIDGTLDRSFATCYGIEGSVYAVTIQPDGKILIGGDFVSYNQTSRTNLARVLPDGSLDTGFLDNYYNQFQPGTDSFIAAISLQQNGNVIIGGGFSIVGGGSVVPGGYAPPDHVDVRYNYARVIGNFTDPLRVNAGRGETENSPGNLQLVQPTYTIDEHVLGGFLAVTVERINGGLGGAQVFYQTLDGSAKSNIDYVPVSGVVQWADCTDGQRLIFIPILDNQIAEGNKNFFIQLSMPSSFGGPQASQPALGHQCKAEITIVDNDVNRGVLGFAQPIFTVSESNRFANITVSRTNGSSGLVTVQFQTFNGSATAQTFPGNGDFIGTNGTLTFQSGETSRTFGVEIRNDLLGEFEENFSVRLFSTNLATGASLGLTNSTVLIFDDETTVSRGSISFTATDFVVSEGGGMAAITLRRTSGSASNVTVEFRTSDLPPGNGAARSGVDYIGVTNLTVTFAPGVTNQTIFIPILPDRFVEGPEQVSLSLANPVGGASLGFINTATLTLQDDDAYGSLSFTAANYYVPEEGGVALVDVIRTGGDAEEVTVDYSVIAGSATDAQDFSGSSGTLTFPDGVVAQTISVPVFNDPDLEGPETVLLSLFNFSKASVGLFTNALLTINDDEAQAVPAGSIDTSFNPVPAPNGFVNAIAIQPDGYLVVGGEFTAFGGVTRQRIARLNIDGGIDATFDPGLGADGAVSAIALQPDGKVLVAGAFTRMGNRNRGNIARLTSAGVLDTSFNPGSGADNPVYALALQPDGRVLIGGDFATFNGISRNGVTRLTANGVNDPSFQPGTGANGTVFAVALLPDERILIGGEFTTVNNVSVPYLARLYPDGSVDPTFDVTAPLNGTVRTIAVQPDGAIVIGGSFTAVGATPRPYVARLNSDGTLDTSFDTGLGPNSIVYSATIQSDGRIVLGGEFTSVNGLTQNRIARLRDNGQLDTSINFGVGANLFVATCVLQTDASIVIGGGFTLFNGYPRSYIARLVGGEDVSPGTIEFIEPGYSVLESGTNVTVTIARVGGSQGQVEVDLVSVDLGSAVGGIDYGVVNEHLIFADGETIKTIVVGVTNDTAVEPNEIFQLALTNVLGGAVLNEGAVTHVTIINDDSAVGFTFPAFNVNEKAVGGNAVVGVQRLGATNDLVTVDYFVLTNVGTATPGLDYSPANGTLVFQPGQTNLTFTLPILDDTLVEGNEFFNVALSNVTGSAVLTLSQAAVNIIDNDFSPGSLTFELTAYSVSESNAQITVTIVRTNGSSGVVTANWSAGGGTALGGIDYIATGGVVSFADGETNKSFTIQIVDDVLVEGNETFDVTISNPTGGSIITGPSAAVVTIEDNEFGPGSLDPTFNPGTGANNPVRSVAVAPDGRVVAGGEFTNFNGVARGHVVRLEVDGSVDLTFDTRNGANGRVNAVGVYPDGRVAAAGDFDLFNGNAFGGVVRLGVDGLPDPSMTQVAGVDGGANALITGTSASMTVVGDFLQPTRRVARFTASGGPDATFTPGNGPNLIVHAIAAHPAGGIVIGGGFSDYNGLPRARVAKVFASGLPDQGWAGLSVSGGIVWAVAVQPDGKVLIGGSFTNVGGQTRNRLARFNANGTLDFGFNVGTGANADVRAITFQPDGRILIGGNFTNYNGATRMRIARLESTGVLDPVFDPGRGADNVVNSMALEPDGKVVIGGAFTMVNGFTRRGVARLNGDQPVARFAAAGISAGAPMLRLQTTPGGLYVIEATGDLENWTPISTNAAAGYEMTISDPAAQGLDRRFYRARQVPR